MPSSWFSPLAAPPWRAVENPSDPYDWAVRFETEAKGLLISGEDRRLVDYEALGREALLSIPTPDHYLPLRYVIGARQRGEAVTFPVEGVDGGSISMLCVEVGQPALAPDIQ
jgi:4,5-DOPA dioxygenase extradiol